jgi:hypothetical protein
LTRVNREASRASQRVKPQENQGHQNPVQIEDCKHTPRHCRVTPDGVDASIELAIQLRYISLLCAVLKLNSE